QLQITSCPSTPPVHFFQFSQSNYKEWKGNVYAYCQEKTISQYLLSNKAATDAMAEQKEVWMQKEISTTTIICRYMGPNNQARFGVQNQSQVYHNFLKISFKTNLTKFLIACKISISNMQAVRMNIAVPKAKQTKFKKNHLAEITISKILPSRVKYPRQRKPQSHPSNKNKRQNQS
ncbi:uncharacterized protein VP01_4882g1, partial [Puccinia sorghi]